MKSFYRHITGKHFCILMLLALQAATAQAASLCAADERIIFSCSLKNSKTISVCAAAKDAPPYVEYKFGKPSKIEMTHRVSQGDAMPAFQRADIIYGNNAVDTIWFKNGEHLYDISMPARGSPAVEVWKNSKLLAHLECTNGWRNVEGDNDIKSPLIINHGNVDISDRNTLWFKK